MSRFMSEKYALLEAYTPGEQPKDRKFIKLNTNESPFAPSKGVSEAVLTESSMLQLYSDPECTPLIKKAAEYYSLKENNLLMTNGSDEILNFAFMAFGDKNHPFAFPSISYGFYPVFANLNGVPFKAIPLKDDFSIRADDYVSIGMNIVIANPNAPTGLTISTADIERIAKSNSNNVVIIDEAYIDFGGESAINLINKYDNLLITRTFSKSFSLAGARLGFGAANSQLIGDLNTIKYSTNPYNINRMTMAAGVAALNDADYYMNNCKTIALNREYTKQKLKDMGFDVTNSMSNFLFASHKLLDGKDFYLKLRKEGILIRHFSIPEIQNYNRITVGTKEQMDAFIAAAEKILSEV